MDYSGFGSVAGVVHGIKFFQRGFWFLSWKIHSSFVINTQILNHY